MMYITDDERVEFLKAHNDIKNMVQTIHDCGDVWVSDLRKLENIEHLLHSVMKFVPQMDDEGRPQYYADYMLAELEDRDIVSE
tara:strand:- start:423 stop:671 length:249 start_codon:yes stop_codon:yes gene_type:complete